MQKFCIWLPALALILRNMALARGAALRGTRPSALELGFGDFPADDIPCMDVSATASSPFFVMPAGSTRNDSFYMPSTEETLGMELQGLERKRQVQYSFKRSPFTGEDPSSTVPPNLAPTPQPSGSSSPTTTVHIASVSDFALLLPNRPGELISDAESDGVAFCTHGSKDASCGDRRMQDGFIRAAAVAHAADGSWIQVTGCIDPSKSSLEMSDDGGQFDVRFPNGAQCAFGGYGASFIEQIEPSDARFCLRCCASANDQLNCNSHRDDKGCPTAIPGNYSFPAIGVDCS